MPQVTVYIRDDDYMDWMKLEKKSEWIHDHLNQSTSHTPEQEEKLDSYFPKKEFTNQPLPEDNEVIDLEDLNL